MTGRSFLDSDERLGARRRTRLIMVPFVALVLVAGAATVASGGVNLALAGYGSGLTIGTGPVLPEAFAHHSYETTLSASGGTPPYTWSVTATGQGSAHYLPTDVDKTPLSFAPSEGRISGEPEYSGTSSFMVTVTDSVGDTASQEESLTVAESPGGQTWSLCLNHACPPEPGRGSGQPDTDPPGGVVVNPHVALVLVGKWWCSLFGSSQPSQCPAKYADPNKCNGCAAESSRVLNAVNNLIEIDYNTPDGYDSGLAEYYSETNCGLGGCTKTYVGQGVKLRRYAPNGNTVFAGPLVKGSEVSCALGKFPAQPTKTPCAKHLIRTLNDLTGGFGVQSQTEVDETVWVLLFAPELLGPNGQCPSQGNLSANGQTPPGGAGVYGSFVYVTAFLEDSAHFCEGDLNQRNSSATVLTLEQFATFAVSHEIDEAITSPSVEEKEKEADWVVPEGGGAAGQIADPCHSRTAAGDTAYHDKEWNYARDENGTVVSAYVNPSGWCTPLVKTSIPPG